MNTRNMLRGIWFCLALAAMLKGGENGMVGSKGGLFSKKLPDGSVLLLEKETHREKTTPPKGPVKDLPKGATYLAAEVVIDHYRLAKLTGKEKAVVWDIKSESIIGVYEGLGPRFIFWDAELVGHKLYVFYCANLYAHLDIVASQSPGRWATIKSEVMKDRIRCLGVGKFFRDSRGFGIRFSEGPGYGVKWDIINDTLRKRPED